MKRHGSFNLDPSLGDICLYESLFNICTSLLVPTTTLPALRFLLHPIIHQRETSGIRL